MKRNLFPALAAFPVAAPVDAWLSRGGFLPMAWAGNMIGAQR